MVQIENPQLTDSLLLGVFGKEKLFGEAVRMF
jgi:hypothetical protein